MASYRHYIRKISYIEQQLSDAKDIVNRNRRELLSKEDLKGSASSTSLHENFYELIQILENSEQRCITAKESLRND